TPGTLRSRASDGTQDWAPSMYLTASPTVARFLTSSSGMRTSNFSSALTTMVIIEMESMSRSSVKELSSLTSSVATPVSSLTISARPARISVSVCAMVSPRLMFCLAVKDYPREGGFSVSRHGWSVWRDRLHPPHATGSGEDQHLPGVCQACAEPELHEHVAALGGALLDEPVGGLCSSGMVGMFAWWGAKTSVSSTVSPDWTSISRTFSAVCHTAQRKTVRPSCSRVGHSAVPSRKSMREPVIRMVSQLSPSLPHTVGPTLGSWLAPTTAAPAPSPSRNEMERSVGETKSESFSAPITSTLRALPERIRASAWPIP